MTPAEQIRAALTDSHRSPHRKIADALAALDALEAEHADGVWLTRDEAKQIRARLPLDHTSALLFERMSVSQKQTDTAERQNKP
jgi:hypothetical protein